jgi:hypothetical protein
MKTHRAKRLQLRLDLTANLDPSAGPKQTPVPIDGKQTHNPINVIDIT